MYTITGDTYAIRTILSAAGCRWDRTTKSWSGDERAAQILRQNPTMLDLVRRGQVTVTPPKAPAIVVEDRTQPSPGAAMAQAILAPVVQSATVERRNQARLAAAVDRKAEYAGSEALVTAGGWRPEDRRGDLTRFKTAAEAIRHAQMDWEVAAQPLFLGNGERINERAVVRQDSGKVLGVVGPKYQPLQNVSAFEFFDEIVGRGEAQYTGAGSFKGGRHVYVQAKLLGASFDVGGGDIVDPYLLLSNGHDGSRAIEIGFTAIRVVCENTLAMAHGELRHDERSLRIRHIGNVEQEIEQAAIALDIARRRFAKTADDYRQLAERVMNLDEARLYWATALEGVSTSAKVQDLTLQRVEQLWARGRGALAGSAWGAYNAITEYLTHERGRERSRKESVLIGDSAKVSQRALELALA